MSITKLGKDTHRPGVVRRVNTLGKYVKLRTSTIILIILIILLYIIVSYQGFVSIIKSIMILYRILTT